MKIEGCIPLLMGASSGIGDATANDLQLDALSVT